MRFYCPNCREEKDVESEATITTLTGRVAYKASCPVCKQDMAEFIPGEKVTLPPSQVSESANQ